MAPFRLLIVAALVALPLWVATKATTNACQPVTLAENVSRADLIVVGKVTQLIVLPPEAEGSARMQELGYTPVEATVAVTEYLKGPGPDTLLTFQLADTVTQDATGVSSVETILTSCGSTVTSVGYYHVMFLTKHDSLRYTWHGGMVTAENVQDVDKYLAEIRAEVAAQQLGLPDTGSGPSPQQHTSRALLIAASALAAVGLAANAAFALRRR